MKQNFPVFNTFWLTFILSYPQIAPLSHNKKRHLKIHKNYDNRPYFVSFIDRVHRLIHSLYV